MTSETSARLTIFEVKFMEIHSFHQVAHRLRLKSSQVWVADFPKRKQLVTSPKSPLQVFNSRVSVEVAAVDCLDQLLRHSDNFLSPQPDAIVLDVVVVGRVRRLLHLLVRRLFGLRDDAFAGPNC